MTKGLYAELLHDPRWFKKRLEILERDEFKCQQCYEKDKTLNVHHLLYLSDKDPWDYPNELLITLCEKCHKFESVDTYNLDKTFSRAFRAFEFSDEDMEELILVLSRVREKRYNPTDLVEAIAHITTNKSIFNKTLEEARDWPL
jgi:hypothetical protein